MNRNPIRLSADRMDQRYFFGGLSLLIEPLEILQNAACKFAAAGVLTTAKYPAAQLSIGIGTGFVFVYDLSPRRHQGPFDFFLGNGAPWGEVGLPFACDPTIFRQSVSAGYVCTYNAGHVTIAGHTYLQCGLSN